MNYSRFTAVSLTIASLSIAACSGDKAKADSTAAKNDSAMAASLAMANADTGKKVQLGDTATGTKAKAPVTKKTAPAPTPTKTAQTPAPAPTPAPTPAAAAPKMGTIAEGTMITLTSGSKVCTDKNAVGDNFDAETAESVSGSNGAAIPAGATVHMTITNLKRSENAKDPVVMEFRVNSISWGGKSYNVQASIASADVTKIRDEPKGKDVQKVAIGAAAGAIAGKLIGKSTKGAVIGGAAGAAAGAGVAVATANYQGCINQGAKIVVKLDGPLQLTVGF